MHSLLHAVLHQLKTILSAAKLLKIERLVTNYSNFLKFSNSGQVLRWAAKPAGPTVPSSEISESPTKPSRPEIILRAKLRTKILPLVGRINYSILSSFRQEVIQAQAAVWGYELSQNSSKASVKASLEETYETKLVSQSQDNKRRGDLSAVILRVGHHDRLRLKE